MLALCTQILIWLSVSGEKAPDVRFLDPITKRAKLKSEYTAPTFQPLAFGLTPHMPMFGSHEIFPF